MLALGQELVADCWNLLWGSSPVPDRYGPAIRIIIALAGFAFTISSVCGLAVAPLLDLMPDRNVVVSAAMGVAETEMIELPLWPSLALPRCGDSATPYLARAEAVSGGGIVALLVSASVRQASITSVLHLFPAT